MGIEQQMANVDFEVMRLGRALADLRRVKHSLTHFDDDGPTLGEVFMLARMHDISLVGYEFVVATDDGVEHRKLVGHFDERGLRDGGTIDDSEWDKRLTVRAARKVWFP